MNKLTKIGLTALAGSLATIAGAQAGALTVSGGSNITWTSTSGSATAAGASLTGNPIGWQNNITFGASGELDNGWTWSANAYNSDAQALTSSNITFDMGSAGSLLVDNGAGGAGLDAMDDKMPTAYEEAWDTSIGSGARTVTGIHGSASLTWTSPADMLPMGTTIRLAWTPKADGGGLQADKGNSGAAGSGVGSGRDITIALAPADGLSVFAGYSERESHDTGATGSGSDLLQGTYGATLAMGPVSFGYQKAYINNDNGATTTVNYYDNTNWGIAFNVNDNLSVSYGDFESQEHNGGTTGGQTLSIESIQVAYSMGAASIKIAETDADDALYTAARSHSATLVTLGLSF